MIRHSFYFLLIRKQDFSRHDHEQITEYLALSLTIYTVLEGSIDVVCSGNKIYLSNIVEDVYACKAYQ